MVAFEWDEWKRDRNRRKHGVDFDEAATVFKDPSARRIYDPRHSREEDRWLLMGHASTGRIVVVAYTHRGAAVRLISARPATRREIRSYDRG